MTGPGGREPAGAFVGRHPYVLAAVVVGALLAVFFGPVIVGNRTFSAVKNMQEYSWPWADPDSPPRVQLYPQLDQGNFVHPRQVFLDRSLKDDGQIPLWDSMTFGGHPFFAQHGSRLAYPPLLLLSLVSTPSWTHDLYVALHLLVAGLAVFALMRQLRVGVHGALLAGVTWALGSYTLSWVMLEMFAAPAAFLPLALLCAHRWYDRRSTAALLAGALALGMLYLGTSAEYALFCYLAVGAYTACLAITWLRREWSGLAARQRLAVAAAPLALMLAAAAVAAVGIVPFLDLSGTSERIGRSHFSRALSIVPLESFRYLLTPPPVPPDIIQATLLLIRSQVFLGSATVVLAAVGLFLRRSGAGLGRGLVVVMFLFTVGTPLTSLALRVVPRLEALNGLGRTLFLFDLGLAVLAGLGLDAVVGALRRRSGRDPETATGPRRVSRAIPALLTAVCIVAAAAQLIPHGRRVNPPFPQREASQLYPETPVIAAAHALIGDTAGRPRIAPVRRPAAGAVLIGTVGMAVDVPTATGYEPLLPTTVTKLWRLVAGEPLYSVLANGLSGTLLLSFDTNRLRTDLLGRVGVAGVMGPPDLNSDPGWDVDSLAARGLRQVYAGADGTLLEVLDRVPRATVVPQATWVETPMEALALFADPGFDARRQVVLEGRARDPGPAAATPAGPPGVPEVEWRRERSNDMSLRVSSDGPGWLVVSDGWDPGWNATVDGRATEVLRANSNFRAVAVPAGMSTVELTYRPTSIVVGGAISLVSVVLILATLVVSGLRRRRASLPDTAGA